LKNKTDPIKIIERIGNDIKNDKINEHFAKKNIEVVVDLIKNVSKNIVQHSAENKLDAKNVIK
jgi:hypothetical protein